MRVKLLSLNLRTLRYFLERVKLLLLFSYLIYNFPYSLFVRSNPLPSESRLRCCDRYIHCHRLLAVKPLSPREHAGRRVGKGGTLGSVHTTAILIRDGRGTDRASSDHLEPRNCHCQR